MAVGDRPASLGIQGLNVFLAMALPFFWPDDPVEAQVAVMNVGLQLLPLTGDFSAHTGLNMLVTVGFGKSATESQFVAWQAPHKMWRLPVEVESTTLHGASSTSGLIAWKEEHGKVSSAEGVEIFHGKPPGFWRKRFIRRQPLSNACTLGKQETEALDEVRPVQVLRLLFSSGDDFPVPALLNPRLLILAKGVSLHALQVAGQALFRFLEARRILVRKFVDLRLELL